MKIAIDVRMIGPCAHGISRYAYNLIKIISEIDKRNSYMLISNDNYLENFVSSHDNFTLKIVNSRLYGIKEQFYIPRILREERVDVFHSPSYFGPVFGGCRMIMTIHDIVPLLFPREYSILHRSYYRTIVKKAAKNANKIITVSENSKKDINKHLGIPLEKIIVTHNAADKTFNINRAEKVSSIKNRFGINGRYLLYVGNLKPHKNVILLIRAYNLLKDRTKHQMVIVGGKDRSALRCLPGELLEEVVFTGEVSDDNLSCFYHGADLYVSASLYEGFGLPLLEAMACGIPVVALKTPSLEEVIGDAGYMVEENSPEEFADAVYNILSDVNKQRSMVEKGLEREKMFSWRKAAGITLKVYEEVARTRILYINLRSDYGGGSTHMYELVRELNSSLFRKYVACPIQKPFYSLYAKIGVNAIPLPARTFSLISFIKLIMYARVNNIDIIHSHGKGAGLYGRLLGVVVRKPVIHTFHGIHYERYSYGKQRLYFLMERIMSEFTRYIINVSESEHAEGIRLGLFSGSVAKVIYNGVETEELRSISVDLKTKKMIDSMGTENTLICTVARFDYVKGIDVALQAVKYLKERYKNFRYLIVGDGVLMGEIVKEINKNQLREHVMLLGFRDDVSGILRMMDIYLSPSRSESMSLTILEAMNIGLPVVATDIPGNRDLLKDGILAKSEDPQDIAKKISTLIENPQLRDRLANKSRTVVKENYSLKKMIRDTENLYYELFNEKEIASSLRKLRQG